MMRVAPLLLLACGVMHFEWRGIPSGEISCTHGYSLDELHCVSDGHAYLCVRDWEQHVVSCSPMVELRGAP